MEDIYRSQFRIPYSLYELLKASADENRRSVNAELISRLESSFSKRDLVRHKLGLPLAEEPEVQDPGLRGSGVTGTKDDLLPTSQDAATADRERIIREHDAAIQVLAEMYAETLERVRELKSRNALSAMEQVDLQHEEHTAKYLRHAAARAAMPPEERPFQKKRSMPLGIDTDVHLATRVAESTPHPRAKK